ncbi:hypothetical protein [Spirosoma luteum]|uniref:hypothetical protein n=1 Tax=Spirosoma luteum TaxID=431553 RepID=UPI00037E3830|nr:hypothetical protein [Spirosoma luteum]
MTTQMNPLAAANIVEMEYISKLIAAKSANWQRIFAPKMREDLAGMINNANQVGMTVPQHLQSHDWDSFEQYVSIKWPNAF